MRSPFCCLNKIAVIVTAQGPSSHPTCGRASEGWVDTAWVHFTLVHRYDFITGKRADIRRGDFWGWGFFHERLIRPYIYVDETIGVGNKKQTRPIVVRCPQRRSS